MFVYVSITTNEIVLRVYWATSPFIPNVSSSGLLLEEKTGYKPTKNSTIEVFRNQQKISIVQN